jgi:hypothetical protein
MLSHLLDEFGHELYRGGDLLCIKVLVVDLDLVSVDRVLRELGGILKKLVKFCHKNKSQVRNRLAVVAHPSLHFFIFDDFDKIVRNQIEQRFSLQDINNGEHHPAHVCAGPADVIHQFDMANFFNDR